MGPSVWFDLYKLALDLLMKQCGIRLFVWMGVSHYVLEYQFYLPMNFPCGVEGLYGLNKMTIFH
jgi:hypothetical protein